MINNRKVFSLSYFLGRIFFVGFGFSLLRKLVGIDSWIAASLGCLLGGGIIYIYSLLRKKVNGNLKNLQGNKFIKWSLIILFFIFNIFVFSQILFVFQTFASSFFLIKSPIYYITLPIPFIIYRICKNGFKTIAKIAEILMPISIFLFLFSFLGMFQYWNIDFFKPVLLTEPLTLLQGTLYFTAYSSSSFFLLLNVPMEKQKLSGKYFFSTITVVILCIYIIGVLGPNLIQIYRYPEYMMLKKIKIFNFIEKVENILSLTWLFDLFMALSIAGNNIKESLPKKRQNIIFFIILIALYFGAILSGIYYQEELILYHVLPIVLGSFEILFLLLLLFIPKKKNE